MYILPANTFVTDHSQANLTIQSYITQLQIRMRRSLWRYKSKTKSTTLTFTKWSFETTAIISLTSINTGNFLQNYMKVIVLHCCLQRHLMNCSSFVSTFCEMLFLRQKCSEKRAQVLNGRVQHWSYPTHNKYQRSGEGWKHLTHQSHTHITFPPIVMHGID